MTQFEFYKSFQFVIELLLAEAMFVFRFRRRRFFRLLLPAAVILCFAFAWLMPVLSENPFYISCMFLLIFVFTVLMNKAVFRESWLTVSFGCVAGYTTQHLAYELYNIWLLAFQFPQDTGFYGSGAFVSVFPNLFAGILYACSYVAVYFAFFMVFSTRLRSREAVKLKSAFIFVLAVSVLVVDIILNAVVVSIRVSGADTLKIIIGIYNILCCIFSMIMQFNAFEHKKLENELGAVELMWHQASKQYEISKENIELINIKYHDLKHQIGRLRMGGGKEEALGEIEEQLAIYGAHVKTGNDALDVILTEKSLLCAKSGISTDIDADGHSLDFMTNEDLYSLFGNMLDNAMAAVRGLEQDKRTIILSIRPVGEMLLVREINYYGEPIEFEDGLPVTRGDRRFHGYGVRSIKYVCDRYEGDLTITAQDGIFTMNILFPRGGRA